MNIVDTPCGPVKVFSREEIEDMEKARIITHIDDIPELHRFSRVSVPECWGRGSYSGYPR
jgi:hypothetical protein